MLNTIEKCFQLTKEGGYQEYQKENIHVTNWINCIFKKGDK